jgi:NAD(P)-dependent dehydrogenase (short-subunit alcohol dehydrogenase family)
MTTFTNKVALVTGAASGIGRATVQSYAREGARVVVSDVDEKGGQETAQLINHVGGEAFFVRADVSDPADCEALVRQAVERYDRLDYACNNAGIGGE